MGELHERNVVDVRVGCAVAGLDIEPSGSRVLLESAR
jgi:hypothetical protein